MNEVGNELYLWLMQEGEEDPRRSHQTERYHSTTSSITTTT